MISEKHLIQALDRMVGPIPDPDPVQVQGELHAYLIQRGQQVAQDLGTAIDLLTPEELAELGRLDVLGTMPDVPQDLALHLAMLQAQAQVQAQDQTRQAVASWHEQRERHRGHHHAANETCTVPADQGPPRRGMELIMAKNPYEDQDANVGQTLGTARLGDLAADLVDGMRRTGLLGPSLALLGAGPGPAGTRRGSSTWRGHGNLRSSKCCASPGVKG